MKTIIYKTKKFQIYMKKNFSVISILFLLVFIVNSYADSNGIFIKAEDVVPGTFGDDEGSNDFAFPSNLLINESLNVINEINSKILSTTKLSVSDSLTYKGDELDDRYLNEKQKDSVNSDMIIDKTISLDDLADNSVNSNKIVNGAISSDDIEDGTIKLKDISTDSLDDTFALKTDINKLQDQIDTVLDDYSFLVGGKHMRIECTKSGGKLQGNFCKFSRSSCPSGWSQYGSWTKTKKKSGRIGCKKKSYNTGEHSFSNKAVESVTISNSEHYGTATQCKGGCPCQWRGKKTFKASVTEVGCY